MALNLVLLLGGGLAFAKSNSVTAKVEKVFLKRGVVKINRGSVKGFTKGKSVCFFQKSGIKIGCGKVRKTSLHSSRVKVSSSIINQIDPSTTARLKTRTFTAGRLTPGVGLKLKYVASALTPFQYGKLSLQERTSAADENGWVKDKDGNSAYVGGALEITHGRSATTFGVKFRSHRPYEPTVKYSGDSEDEVTVLTEASSFGLYGEYILFESPLYQSRRYRFGVGLDLDSSTVNIKVDRIPVDQSAIEMFTYKSNLTVASLRVAPGVSWHFSDWAFHLEAAVLLPVVESLSASYNDASDGDTITAEAQLKEALDHSKAIIGLESSLGLGVIF